MLLSYIVYNPLLGLILSGLFIGSFGFFIPSNAEKTHQLFSTSKFSLSKFLFGAVPAPFVRLVSVIFTICFLLIVIGMGNITILKFFGAYPLNDRDAGRIVSFIAVFSFLLSKALRYLIDRYRR